MEKGYRFSGDFVVPAALFGKSGSEPIQAKVDFESAASEIEVAKTIFDLFRQAYVFAREERKLNFHQWEEELNTREAALAKKEQFLNDLAEKLKASQANLAERMEAFAEIQKAFGEKMAAERPNEEKFL